MWEGSSFSRSHGDLVREPSAGSLPLFSDICLCSWHFNGFPVNINAFFHRLMYTLRNQAIVQHFYQITTLSLWREWFSTTCITTCLLGPLASFPTAEMPSSIQPKCVTFNTVICYKLCYCTKTKFLLCLSLRLEFKHHKCKCFRLIKTSSPGKRSMKI